MTVPLLRLRPRDETRCPCAHEAGALEVRLAASEADLRAAQALRWRVFYDELGAVPPAAARSGIDEDAYDPFCDHLLVIDRERSCVVGTYRLLRQMVADQQHGFYSSAEYDLSPLVRHAAAIQPAGQLLELGRSCVDAAYRTSATISLLWRGIASYLDLHAITYLFGCASFHGDDPGVHAAELAYLWHHHLSPPEIRVQSLPAHYVPMDVIPADRLDAKAAARALPPLLRGYLRVGATVGDGAFIDRAFNTVDVFVVMPVAGISRRYAARFSDETGT